MYFRYWWIDCEHFPSFRSFVYFFHFPFLPSWCWLIPSSVIVVVVYFFKSHLFSCWSIAKPRSRPVLQSGLPRSTTAKVGDNIALKCVVQASAYPTLPDFRWFKWDRNITSEPKISINSMMKANGLHQLVDPVRYTTIKVGEHHGVQLEIYNVTENDYGLYTCFVNNRIGYDYSSAFVMKVGISSKPPGPTTSGKSSTVFCDVLTPFRENVNFMCIFQRNL